MENITVMKNALHYLKKQIKNGRENNKLEEVSLEMIKCEEQRKERSKGNEGSQGPVGP